MKSEEIIATFLFLKVKHTIGLLANFFFFSKVLLNTGIKTQPSVTS